MVVTPGCCVLSSQGTGSLVCETDTCLVMPPSLQVPGLVLVGRLVSYWLDVGSLVIQPTTRIGTVR